eukprot:CAMPEP_0202702404 /NCGR_PEP_ID=MMETSP1385-20130828/15387_1 /ASSEMBLY_ACC=CAM_ASM_000861 /TAXON_ID=933848 /ORGANISM="Elphidium margaritaceum" /LENGTH=417 /DNA_ID=CAMNT_0049360045 /DNA_START=260 /DNA_END=1513 /DNA_ORIENTATION=-
MKPVNVTQKRHLVASPVSMSTPQNIFVDNHNNSNSNTHNNIDYETSVQYCYDTLEKVSRSFALVIQQLPADIRDSICIFYLVLRALDSIEDDMQHFSDLQQKCVMLDNFHRILDQTSYSVTGIGDKQQYQELLENFTNVLNVYHSLSTQHKQVIQDITQQMAFGMREFVVKQWNATQHQPTLATLNGDHADAGTDTDTDTVHYSTRIESLSDYNEYCYYVAGIIGNGLSEIFSKSGLEDEEFCVRNAQTGVNMGLFLQKTNITRDYLEDVNEGRIFWPHEILSKYVDSANYFKLNPNSTTSKQCLNHMVYDAINHIDGSIEYLSDIGNEQIFKFCAIPQVMAIATLEKCYNNSNVFKKEVKISKPLTLQIVRSCDDIKQVRDWFKHFLYRLNDRLDWFNDPNAKNINQVIIKSLELL